MVETSLDDLVDEALGFLIVVELDQYVARHHHTFTKKWMPMMMRAIHTMVATAATVQNMMLNRRSLSTMFVLCHLDQHFFLVWVFSGLEPHLVEGLENYLLLLVGELDVELQPCLLGQE